MCSRTRINNTTPIVNKSTRQTACTHIKINLQDETKTAHTHTHTHTQRERERGQLTFRIRPEQVTHWAIMRHFLFPVDSTYLI